jgi:CRP-like cAMP-binding protein
VREGHGLLRLLDFDVVDRSRGDLGSPEEGGGPLPEQDAKRARSVFDRVKGEDWYLRCSDRALEAFARAGVTRRMAHGEMLSQRGDMVEALAIILDGTLEVSITTFDGRRHVLGFVGQGQLVNLIPILDDQVAIHDFYTHQQCELFIIPKSAFIDVVDSEPVLARHLMRLLCLRSRVLYDRLADASLLPLRSRCARAILSLLPVVDVQQPQAEPVQIQLAQWELADMVGVSRQTLNAELRRLEDLGVIERKYSNIRVTDMSAFMEIAASEY